MWLSNHLVRLQAVLLIQSVQQNQMFLHSREVNAQVSVHTTGEAALQLVALCGH